MEISSVFVLTGGNVLFASEMKTHYGLLKRMEGLSNKKLIVCGTPGGLKVGALDSVSSGPGLSPAWLWSLCYVLGQDIFFSK